LSNYSTISVPGDVKKVLEETKGDRDWGRFLMDLYQEAEKARRTRAFNELAEMLTEEDIESIADSSKELREKLKIG
jgi:predicted CopG family antitoxin